MISCIEREITFRRRMYPHLCASNKMRFDVAEKEMNAICGVLDLLRQTQAAQQFRAEGVTPLKGV
jgi:hypothetical protein